MKFDTPSDSNKSSSPDGFLSYMEKEDREKGLDKELWFNEREDFITPHRIIEDIQSQKGLGKNDYWYYTGSVSFSEEELLFLNNDNKKLKQFGKAFISEYASNFNKGLAASDVRFYSKLESNRYYKGTDKEVQAGEKNAGDKKPGLNTHFHFIVGRKSRDDSKKLSPLSNHINTNTGAVTGGFSRDNLKERTEILFDNLMNYNRPIEQTYQHFKNVRTFKDFSKRTQAIEMSVDKSQSLLKYDQLTIDEKEKKLNVLMNYMQHGQERANGVIQMDTKAILKEAQKQNFNGDIYKALLNMNYRLKGGFQPQGDVTPFIIEYARFVGAPYSKLPDSLKEDRFTRFAQIINQRLPKGDKLDAVFLFKAEKSNGLNGRVYKALGEFNKLIKEGEVLQDANKVVIKLSQGKDIVKVQEVEQEQKIESNKLSNDKLFNDISSSLIGNINISNSGAAYKEEQKPKKKKNRMRPH
nr:DUF5712 family protein [uncultured Carboxylicivirga sp.]